MPSGLVVCSTRTLWTVVGLAWVIFATARTLRGAVLSGSPRSCVQLYQIGQEIEGGRGDQLTGPVPRDSVAVTSAGAMPPGGPPGDWRGCRRRITATPYQLCASSPICHGSTRTAGASDHRRHRPRRRRLRRMTNRKALRSRAAAPMPRRSRAHNRRAATAPAPTTIPCRGCTPQSARSMSSAMRRRPVVIR